MKTVPEQRAEQYGLEPAAMSQAWVRHDPPSEAEIELSRTISLKRIADSLAHIEAVTCNPLVSVKPNSPGRAAGGRARAAKLSPTRRSQIARDAADTRWGNR